MGCSSRQRVSNAHALKLQRNKKISQTSKAIPSTSVPGKEMFIEPAKADEPWTRRAKSALKNKCPSSCPSRQERVRNKKAGQCSLPRPNEQPCSPSVLFCSFHGKRRRLS